MMCPKIEFDLHLLTVILCSFFFGLKGSISNIDDSEYKCHDGTAPEVRNKVISGVVGAPSSVTSIQVANLLRLFKIPQVFSFFPFFSN